MLAQSPRIVSVEACGGGAEEEVRLLLQIGDEFLHALPLCAAKVVRVYLLVLCDPALLHVAERQVFSLNHLPFPS